MNKDWKLSSIGKQYSFSAAHCLPCVAEDHPCHRMHGHNYVVEVEIRGDTKVGNEKNSGFCNGVDFVWVDSIIKPLIEKLDHHTLNDIIENPTAENIAEWFLANATPAIFYSVTVWETPKCWAKAINSEGIFHKAHRD